MLMSVVLGAGLMVITQMFAPQMLMAVATNGDMFAPALQYLLIRSYAQPAVSLNAFQPSEQAQHQSSTGWGQLCTIFVLVLPQVYPKVTL